MMLKAAVALFMYGLLAIDEVWGDPMIKMKICSDVLEGAFNDSFKSTDQSMLRKELGDVVVQTPRWNNGLGGQKKGGKSKSTELSVNRVSFTNLRGRVESSDSMEIRAQSKIRYGEKLPASSNGRWKKQNVDLIVEADIIATFRFQNEYNNLQFVLKGCEVFISKMQSEWLQEMNLQSRKYEESLRSRLCNILPSVTDQVNHGLVDMLKIDPSGSRKLVIKTIKYSNLACLEIDLNLAENGTEKTSEQTHSYLLNNGISLLKDYINDMLSVKVHAEQLNKILAAMSLNLSPEELQLLIHDVYETDPVKLKINIKESPKLTQDSGNATFTISATVDGFSSKSEDEPVFAIDVDILLDAELYVKGNKLFFLVSATEVPKIHSWASKIGKTGDLDYANLEDFIKKFTNETILPVINNLQINIRIPRRHGKCNEALQVIAEQDSVVILSNMTS